MRTNKRVLSFILMLATVLSLCTVPYQTSAASVTVTATDISITDKLSALDVISPVAEDKLSATLTRGDMIPVLIKYLRLENAVPGSSTTPFLDVNPFDIHIGEYRYLYDAGVISGDENKNFSPDKTLTYNEAITFVVNAMGYKLFAERNGGYPTGYLYVANKYGLLEGLKGSGTAPIPYCDVYRLIHASVHASAVVANSYDGNGDAELKIDTEVTVLEDLYGIKITSGIVTGTEDTRLLTSGSQLIDRNQLEIDGILFETPNNEYAHFIGKRVVAYYKEDSSPAYTVVYLEEHKGNREYTIAAEDLLVQETTNDRIYYTDENDKTKHLSTIGSGISVIYNGKYYTGYGALKNALPEQGYVVALDNNGDDVIDVLFVYEYVNIYVGSIDFNTKTYYDKLDNTKYVVLDSDEDDIRVYDADGNLCKTNAIVAGDIITVMESVNTAGYKLKTVYISNTVVEGKVEEFADGKYLINGLYYETAKSFEDYVAMDACPAISVGSNVILFLDHFGEIAFCKRLTDTDATYGFIAGIDTQKNVNNTVSLKIYNQSGAWLELDLADKVKVDETLYQVTSDSDVVKVLSKISVNEVVLYKVNSGKIDFIDTARSGGDLTIIAEGDSLSYKEGLASIGYGDTSDGKFVAPPNKMIIFEVPAEDELLIKTEQYNIRTSLDTNGLDEFIAYNLGDEDINAATCILAKGGSSSTQVVKRTDMLSVVLKSTNAVNADGEAGTRLYYSTNGAEYSALIGENLHYCKSWSGADGNTLTATRTPITFKELDLKPGDVVQIGKDIEGYIVDINVIYRADQTADNAADAYFTDDTFLSRIVLSHGSAHGLVMAYFDCYDVEKKFIKFYIPDGAGGKKEYYIGVASAYVSAFNSANHKGEALSAENLMKDEKIVIKTTAGYASVASQVIALR